MRTLPWILGFSVLLAASAAILGGTRSPRSADSPGERITARLPGPPEEPRRLADDQGRMLAVQHKDRAGLCPLEVIQTPEGLVTVQRTFNAEGVVLKEEAFLDGKAVPVPEIPVPSK